LDSGPVGGEPHVVAMTDFGGLCHAVRHGGGVWTIMGNVKQMTGDPGAVLDVAAGAGFGLDGAGVAGQIQVAVATGNGGLFHAIRAPQGAWTPMGNVKQMTGDPGQVMRVGLSG
jgi:hypothetical protein